MKIRVKTCCLVLGLLCGVTILLANTQVNLAISSFEGLRSADKNENSGDELARLLEKRLKASDHLRLRPAGAIEAYLDKLTMCQAGLLQTSAINPDRYNLDVDNISVGSISKPGSLYEIDSRLVNVNTWEIEHACGVSTSNYDYAVESISHDYGEFLVSKDTREDNSRKELPRITVFRFRDSNEKSLERNYGNILSEILNTELGTRKGLVVVERRYSKSLIHEKEFRMTGVLENTDPNDGFRSKGIQYQLAGEVRSFEDIICVKYSLSDTVTGRSVLSGYHEISGSHYFRPLAKGMVSDIEGVVSKEAAVVQIDCNEGSINVLLDGKPLGDVRKLRLAKGTYQLQVRKPGFSSFDKKIALKPGSTLKIPVKLTQTGKVREEKKEDTDGWKPEWERRVWNAHDKASE